MSALRRRRLTRADRRRLEARNAARSAELVVVPPYAWPGHCASSGLLRVWESSEFLVQMHAAQFPVLCRLTVNRTEIVNEDWRAGISWEELQAIKRACGFGDRDAVEVYPADADIVNVGNLRHLWVFEVPLRFAWRARGGAQGVKR